MVEKNHWGKGENTGNQHFLHFPHCFQKAFSSGVGQKSLLYGKSLTEIVHVICRKHQMEKDDRAISESLNPYAAKRDTITFCGQCRSRSDYTECAD